MKSTYLRAGVAALACALGLSACGGSSGQLALGGTIYGLTKEQIVLQNNGAHDYTITPSMLGAGGTFYFPDLIGIDEAYKVTVKSYPSNVTGCTVNYGTGRSAFNVTNIQIVCALKTHKLGGTISNLKGDGLVLVNGTDKVTVPAGVDRFEMTAVGEDQPFGITVLSSPANQSCVASNASGIMGNADKTDVVVTCTP